MIFFSRNGAFRQVLQPSRYAFKKQGEYEEKVPEFGITAQFDPLPGQGVHLQGRLWKGKLNVESEVRRLNRAGWEDVTEATMNLALMNHENYGTEFIAFGDDGEAVEDDALLTTVGDGSFKCECCDQVIKNAQGIQGHFGSEKHKTHRAEYIESLRRTFRL